MNRRSGLTFEFFPVNLHSGPEFLVVYFVIGVLGVLLARGVQGVVLGLFDPALKPAPRSPIGTSRAPYGVPQGLQPEHERLTIGHFPRPDESYSIAYLRGGLDAVADVIVARATAEGWLIGHQGGSFTIHDPPPHATAASRELKTRLPHGSATVGAANAAAQEIARRLERGISEELRGRGLLRGGDRLALGVLSYGLVASGVLGLGVMRAVRGHHLGRPIGLLIAEMIVLALVFARFARPQRQSGHGQRYLAWLDGATETLRSDVQAHRTVGYDDVALAAAIGGVVVVPALVLASTPLGSAVASSAWGSSSTSSCSSGSTCSSSSSSCSSGGGCGGSSSCGGGGGCGG